jgi:hypothetical protein
MSVIFAVEVALAALSLFAIVAYLVLQAIDRRQKQPIKFEPDLELVDKPELISKIPENETLIPDSNSEDEAEVLKRA